MEWTQKYMFYEKKITIFRIFVSIHSLWNSKFYSLSLISRNFTVGVVSTFVFFVLLIVVAVAWILFIFGLYMFSFENRHCCSTCNRALENGRKWMTTDQPVYYSFFLAVVLLELSTYTQYKYTHQELKMKFDKNEQCT